MKPHENTDPFVIAGKTYASRLLVGTGKYKDYAQNAAALEASGAEMVTVAVRRVNVMDPGAPKLIDFIDPKKFVYLPNTAGCFTAEDALRTLLVIGTFTDGYIAECMPDLSALVEKFSEMGRRVILSDQRLKLHYGHWVR